MERNTFKKTSSSNTGLYAGRFQPFHAGHQACVYEILKKHKKCVICVRDIEVKDKKNPLSPLTVRNIIEDWIDLNKLSDKVCVRYINDFDSIYIGRDVGYGLIQLNEELEKISATDIRKLLYL